MEGQAEHFDEEVRWSLAEDELGRLADPTGGH